MKRIEIDRPIYFFILVFAVLFSYTVLSHYPPEEMTQINELDVIEPEPIVKYDDNDITTSDNVTVLDSLSVNERGYNQ